MGLLWPELLYLLGIIPLILGVYIWILRRRQRFAVRFSSLGLVREALPRYSFIRRHLPFALFLLAVSSLVVALGRPVSTVTVPTNQATIVLALDVSRSMCATDVLPNRLEAAKRAALNFIEHQTPSTQIGVVAFGGFAVVVQPPTNDQELLQDAINDLTTGRRTAIGSGIVTSLEAIAEFDKSIPPVMANSTDFAPTPVPPGAYAPAIIVLLTDGVSNSGPHPLVAAQQAVDRGIQVYTIGFGTATNDTIPNCSAGSRSGSSGGQQFGSDPQQFGGSGGFRRGIDEETLKQIAEMTGAKYFSAESASELESSFQSVPTHLITRTETTEISVFFAAIGALLIGIAIVLALLWHPVF